MRRVSCLHEMEVAITQEFNLDPRIDYACPGHPDLQYVEVDGERITVGQALDRYKAMSYIHRHSQSPRVVGLIEALAALGIPTDPPSEEQIQRYVRALKACHISMPQYMARYSAWYNLICAWYQTRELPPLPNPLDYVDTN